MSSKEKTRKITSFVIEGQIKCKKKVDFKETKLAVHAFLGGKEIAQAKVDEKGAYRLVFKNKGGPSRVELRLLPAKLSKTTSSVVTLRKFVGAGRFKLKKMSEEAYYADADMEVSYEYILFLGIITKTYHIHGSVWAKYEDLFIEPVPGVKIDFYEFDITWQGSIWNIRTREGHIGTAYSAPDGSYDFTFDFTYSYLNLFFWIGTWWPVDEKPDIIARISQFRDGEWVLVHQEPVQWNIEEDFHKDFFIDYENVILDPEICVPPSMGFIFTHIGLLPIDRLTNGYATADISDDVRVRSIRNQPQCGILDIHGLFGEDGPWVKYKVQVAETDGSGVVGNYRYLYDSFTKHKYISATEESVPYVLGPDENNYYINVDADDAPGEIWMEPMKKIAWNTKNYNDGYYYLRIIGQRDDGTEQDFGPILLRIDNSPPTAEIRCTESMDPCGVTALKSSMSFEITAFDPNGHVLSWKIIAKRGVQGKTVGEEGEPRPIDLWPGVENEPVSVVVHESLYWPSNCDSVAHSFELTVQGSATDCRHNSVGSQKSEDETNLILEK